MNIGDKAPEFKLKNQDNEDVSLNDFKGKYVLLYFYPKDNTPGCTKQAISFTEHIKTFHSYKTEVIGISKDSVKTHKNFSIKQNLTITLLSDPETKVNELYEVWKEKSMYGRTYFGTERTTFLINPNGEIVNIWKKVKVNNHISDVLNYLKENI